MAERRTKKELEELVRGLKRRIRYLEKDAATLKDMEELENAHIQGLEFYLKKLKILQGELNRELEPENQEVWLWVNRKLLEMIISDLTQVIQGEKLFRGDYNNGERPMHLSVEELWQLAEATCHGKNQMN